MRQDLDKIHIRDLQLRCIIGINPEEREKKQDVIINITLSADLRQACRSDCIDDTVDYKTIKTEVAAMTEGSRFLLVERLADEIAAICLRDARVLEARVLIEKPGALRFARTVGVEITRAQDVGK
ncbi:MAG: dihydroneopterin aldolase [Lentisphaerae bacterium]|jgi:D-erythro-7,8-dihydroneopterin triphosphate epimerase|nr:dihydroneopterin aldolase [Lentisphaerota bacterium]MBT4818887.1 dihydroneopterin aldolase [Lentisphaerota bacterium]MBT5610168.1 dihydroneopterin aldolase [Lentisphaerota bacterium]MBT7057099.1 dihydroneopterin aldolase [Lentisphaerota bacterium]MBT7846178.1 dihydroneopterin aldolase [Lentisphaerota bacterium]